MSQDFRKVLLKDPKLCSTDVVSYGVYKGGASNNYQRFNAVGSSPFTSAITFNVQVPSQEVVMSRQILIRTTIEFSITGGTLAAMNNANPPVFINTSANGGDGHAGCGYLFAYGCGVDSLAPFPFSQLCSTIMVTVNNNTVSLNCRDVLAIICRIHDKRFMQRYNGCTPTLPDFWGGSDAGYLGLINSAGSGDIPTDSDLIPRGAFMIDEVSGTNYEPLEAASRTYVIRVTVTEPVLVSPFVFSGDLDACGAYGLQNLTLLFNLTSANTAIRFGNPSVGPTGNVAARFLTAIPTVTASISSAELLVQFITPHASQLNPSRNVIPYYELPRYISSCAQLIPATGNSPAYGSVPGTIITVQAIQLNSIPDKIYIAVGKPVSNRTNGDTDCWLPIVNISINWNNTSGILSSATQQDLWKMSCESGVNMSWLEFSGKCLGPSTASPATPIATSGTRATFTTCGSVLCLTFGEHIPLAEDYYAPGSLGNFVLQFSVSVANYTGADIAANQYQVVTMLQNSGVMSIERGVSSTYLGLLSKADVLDASRSDAPSMSMTQAQRMVGSGDVPSFYSRLKSVLGKVVQQPEVKALGMEALKKITDKAGLGYSGGGPSGGASGGSRKKHMGSLEDRLR